MPARRPPTSDELRRSFLTLVGISQAAIVLIGIGALLGGVAAVIHDRPTVGLTLAACGLAAALVSYTVLSYLQLRVTMADEQHHAPLPPQPAPPSVIVRSED